MSRADENDIAALIGSRICHDLVNPVGAIGNGVELLGMTAPASDELALIAESVAQAQARIRLLRLAFGAAAADARIAGQEVAATIAAPALNDRLRMRCTLPEAVARREARLAALLVLCCQSIMPRGGEIALRAQQGGWQIDASAERLHRDKAAWTALTGGAAMPALAPAEVQFALAAQALLDTGRRLQADGGEGWLRLSF